MQFSAVVIKFISVVFQYGLLFLLLLFIYRTLKYMRQDSRPILDDIYAKTEIVNEQARLTVLGSADEELTGRQFVFSHELSIGRGAGNDVVVNDAFASHQHARIVMLNNLYVIEDLGSANHTFVNDKMIEGRQYLKSGDIISIGTAAMEFVR